MSERMKVDRWSLAQRWAQMGKLLDEQSEEPARIILELLRDITSLRVELAEAERREVG